MIGIACKNKNINQNCRILIYGNFLIFYKIVDDENINILRILNSKIDYENI